VSFAARAAAVAAAMLVATAGCDSVFRFDQPASSGNDDGAAPETSTGDDAGEHPPCTDDTTCAGLHCQVSSGMCVACVGDTDCSGARRHCDTSAGVCVECNSTVDCGLGRRCNVATKRCIDTCIDSDDPCAAAGFVCDGDLKLCIECKSSENCSEPNMPHVCDLPIGRCVECTANAQCPSTKPVCDRRSGKCEACVTSAECASGAVCDPATLTCRPL
jgi:hypothetical protein